MRIKIILSLAVISLIFLLCVKEKSSCTLVIITSYDGFGIDGQSLGSGKFSESFQVDEGDCFYEDHSGHWLPDPVEKEDYETIAKIKKIDSECVEAVINKKEMKIKYNLRKEVPSTFTVSDGTNYYHIICFKKYTE